MVWLYHAHHKELSNTNLGAVGALIITGSGKKTSNTILRPNDVDREIVIFMHNFDEVSSDYLQKNLNLYKINMDDIFAPIIVSPYKKSIGVKNGADKAAHARLLIGDRNVKGTFALAAQKAAINGYMYGNFFGKTKFSFTEGQRLRVYVINLGTYQDQFVDSTQGIGSLDGMHSFFMSNQVFSGNVWHVGTRSNTGVIGALPASMQVADTTIRIPNDAGANSVWMMGCGMDFLHASGMSALYTVAASKKRETVSPQPRATKTYNLMIEEEVWDYAPNNKNMIDNSNWGTGDSGFQMTQSATTIGRKYLKARYFEYNGDWSARIEQPAQMGILGPAIRATVGDTIIINLRNNASKAYSIHPAGVLYNKQSEGFPINDGVSGESSGVPPGGEFQYTWTVPPSAGPQQNDGSSIVWTYTSRNDYMQDVQAGLVGPIVISSVNAVVPTQELFVLVAMFDENYSPYIQTNLETYTTQTSIAGAAAANPSFPYTNWMFSLNGYMFGNMPEFTTSTASDTRVYFLSVGKVDGGPHAIKFDSGIAWEFTGSSEDVMQLMPAMTRTIDIRPRIPGNWIVHCHTTVHSSRGMSAMLQVTGPERALPSGTQREYFLRAEKVVWSYTNSTNQNAMEGRQLATGDDYDQMEQWLRVNSPNWIGDPLIKARFFGYTDNTFSTRAPVPEEWRHLGIQGPVIRATVGDVITIRLRNDLEIPVSIYPQGLTYKNGPNDDVNPGGTKTYTWYVTEEAGPGSADVSSTAWLYYSQAGGEAAGQNAGLFGTIIVTAANKVASASNLKPNDVDREFVIYQSIIDESQSPFFTANSQFKNSLVQGSSDRPSLNGLMYGNLEGLDLGIGEKCRFYVMTSGSFSSLHTFHTHGHTLLHNKENVDVVELFPTGHAVADMIPDVTGEWMLHCHYSTHLTQGMVTTYTVTKSGGGSTSSAAVLCPLFSMFVMSLFALVQ